MRERGGGALAKRRKKSERRTCVSLLPRNGVCPCFFSSERMTSFKASNDVLISAPSMRVCLDAWVVSAPRSLPAKSMKLSFPMVLGCGGGWTLRRPAAAGPSPPPRSEWDAPRVRSRSTSCITWWGSRGCKRERGEKGERRGIDLVRERGERREERERGEGETWCDREDSKLAPVEPVERWACARAMRSNSCFVGCTGAG